MPLSIVYVLTNPAMPGLVKIGRTSTEEAITRIAQLYSTGVPFPFKLEFACKVENPDEVEQALHRAFAPDRVNPRREFFSIEPDQAIAILKLLHVQDATSEVDQAPSPIGTQEINAGADVRGGDKVFHWSGGDLRPRRSKIQPVVRRSFVLWTKGSRRDVCRGSLRGGSAICFQ